MYSTIARSGYGSGRGMTTQHVEAWGWPEGRPYDHLGARTMARACLNPDQLGPEPGHFLDGSMYEVLAECLVYAAPGAGERKRSIVRLWAADQPEPFAQLTIDPLP